MQTRSTPAAAYPRRISAQASGVPMGSRRPARRGGRFSIAASRARVSSRSGDRRSRGSTWWPARSRGARRLGVTSPGPRPASSRPAVTCSGVVLYADASQPSPSRATRRSPASDPQLPIQIGGPPRRVGRGSRTWVDPSSSRPQVSRAGSGPPGRTAASAPRSPPPPARSRPATNPAPPPAPAGRRTGGPGRRPPWPAPPARARRGARPSWRGSGRRWPRPRSPAPRSRPATAAGRPGGR